MNELKKPSGKKLLAILLMVCMCVGMIPAERIVATEIMPAMKQEVVEVAQTASCWVYFDWPEDFQKREYWDVEVEYGSAVSAPPEEWLVSDEDPERKILGWTLEEGSTVEYDFSTPVTQEYLYLYPILNKREVRFYYPNDFETYYTRSYVKVGDTVSAPTENLSNGYRNVIGWSTERNGRELYDFSQPVNEDIRLYAITDKCRVRIYDDEANYYKKFYVEPNSKLEVPEDVPVAKDGEVIIWRYYDEYEDEDKYFDFDTVINQDYELSIIHKTEFTVNFNFPGDFYYTHRVERITVKPGETVENQVVSNGERTITGWSLEYGSKEPYDFSLPVNKDLELYPIMDKCLLYFYDGGSGYNGAQNYGSRKIYVNPGEAITTLPEQPKRELYDFLGWRISGEEGKFDFSTPIFADNHFYAMWEKKFNFRIRLWNYDTRDTRGLECSYAQVLNGTSIEDAVFSEYPQPKAREGYVFTGWYYDKDCTIECKKDSKFDAKYQYRYCADYDYNQNYRFELYAGWKKSVSDEKNIGYATAYVQDINEYNFKSYFVEKGTKWKDIGLKAKYTREDPGVKAECITQYYADVDKAEVIDLEDTITENTQIYSMTKYDMQVTYTTFGDPSGQNTYTQSYESDIYDIHLVDLPTLVRDGYTFTGWYMDPTCYWKVQNGANLHKIFGGRLFAGWQKGSSGVVDYNQPNINYASLNFVYNTENVDRYHDFRYGYYANVGADAYNCNQIFVENGKNAAEYKQMVGEPTRAGHYFMGWYLDKAYTKPFDFNAPLTGEIVVYAKWGKNPDGSMITPQNGNEVPPVTESGATAVSLSKTEMVLPKGERAVLTATVVPATASLTWESSDARVASVVNGTVTANGAGKAVITAKAANGVQASCTVTVAEVTLNAKSTVLKVGTSSDAVKVATKYPANDKVKSYTSSNTSVVKVNKKGKLTAGKKTGKATITVLMQSGAKASYSVTVQKKAVKTKKLTLDKKNLTLKKGKSITLIATRNPISAKEKITWSTSNKKVAAVNKKGKVTAKKKGKATITAKTSNGKKATCKITVK